MPSKEQLLGTAESLIYDGYRIIPLHGDDDSGSPKKSVINWKTYQQRPLHLRELGSIIESTNAQALGIITGHASGNLIVVDCDNEKRLIEFRAALHGLYNRTMRVDTARGQHIYIRLPYDFVMKSQRIEGADLQSNGRYVVSVYSTVNGHRYTRSGATKPATATHQEAELIQAWFNARKIEKELIPSADEAAKNNTVSTITNIFIKSFEQAQSYYFYRLEVTSSRNQALFDTSLKCRDSGQPSAWTAAALIETHITAAAPASHRSETPEQREAEARATIASAYSRGARTAATIEPIGLPNNVREALHDERKRATNYGNQSTNPRLQSSALALLDALRLSGIAPGQTFSYTSAKKILSGYVSKHVIFYGIEYLKENGFLKNPPRTPITPLQGVASSSDDENKKTAKSLNGHFRKKLLCKTGRREMLYIMPSNLELCSVLGLPYSRISDELTLDDCNKPSKYRRTLHAKFIDRRPGTHARKFLSGRVGVCFRTIQRYNQRENVKYEYQHTAKLISWANAGYIPEQPIGGHFLRINGKDYPPIAAIAMRELKKGREVLYCERTASYYYRGAKPVAIALNLHQQDPMPIKRPQSQTYAALPMPDETPAQLPPEAEPQQLTLPTLEAATAPIPSKPKRDRKADRAYRNESKRFKQPLYNPVKEAIALKIRFVINKLEGKDSISLTMARRIAYYCEASRIKTALSRAHGKFVESPVKFFVMASGYPAIKKRLEEAAKHR